MEIYCKMGTKLKFTKEIREELTQKFIEWGLYDVCEARVHSDCTGGYLPYLTWSHSQKVRWWKDDFDVKDVLRACQVCHATLEFPGRDECYRLHRELIGKRITHKS